MKRASREPRSKAEWAALVGRILAWAVVLCLGLAVAAFLAIFDPEALAFLAVAAVAIFLVVGSGSPPPRMF